MLSSLPATTCARVPMSPASILTVCLPSSALDHSTVTYSPVQARSKAVSPRAIYIPRLGQATGNNCVESEVYAIKNDVGIVNVRLHGRKMPPRTYWGLLLPPRSYLGISIPQGPAGRGTPPSASQSLLPFATPIFGLGPSSVHCRFLTCSAPVRKIRATP